MLPGRVQRVERLNQAYVMTIGDLRVCFSKKKLENHKHEVALHSCLTILLELTKSCARPSAMEAKVSDSVWSFKEIVKLIDAQ
jgi:hypothetical protein